MLCSGPDTRLKALLPVRLGTSAPPSNTWFPSLTRLNVPNSISIGSAVFAELTTERPYMGHPFPSKLPISMGRSEPHRIHDSLGPSEPSTQTASRLVQPFLHSLPQCPYTLQCMAAPSPSKLPLPVGICTPSNLIHGSFGPPESSTQRASRSVETVFAGML